MSRTTGESQRRRAFDGTVIAISMGDPNGIGPEVVLKGVSAFSSRLQGSSDGEPRMEQATSPAPSDPDPIGQVSVAMVLYGSSAVLDGVSRQLGLSVPSWKLVCSASEVDCGGLHLVDVADPAQVYGLGALSPGMICANAGRLSMLSVERAAKECLNGMCDGLVTAPISKEAIHLAGYDVPGHTEFLGMLSDVDEVGMLMVHERLRIGLATIHVPLRDVSRHLTADHLLGTLRLFSTAIEERFGILSPAVAVLGLNPHAGDGGVLGPEESAVISPALEAFRKEGGNVSGPFPADAYFARSSWKGFDLTLAMYHDQGLIPFKMLDQGRGVNMTVGLPFVRTSPDHGTAFDIAGEGVADHRSFLSALDLCLMTVNRERGLNP